MQSVLLYSTGLDSECYRLLLQPKTLLFFTSGASYEKHEIKQLDNFRDLYLSKHNIVVEHCFDFKNWEDKGMIVPMRNVYYLLKAFDYGNTVYIGVSYWDLHYDKQPDTLFGLTNFVKSYYFGRETPKIWDNNMPVILTPYRHLTKGEILGLVLSKYPELAHHFQTLRTCYSATSKQGCGECKSCVQKAMALAHCGLFTADVFDKDPRKNSVKWANFYRKNAKGNIELRKFEREYQHLLSNHASSKV